MFSDGSVHLRVDLGQDVFLPEGRWTVESEHRRGERNPGRRQTGSMYTPAYRVLVSSEFTEGSFIPRQTGEKGR